MMRMVWCLLLNCAYPPQPFGSLPECRTPLLSWRGWAHLTPSPGDTALVVQDVMMESAYHGGHCMQLEKFLKDIKQRLGPSAVGQ